MTESNNFFDTNADHDERYRFKIKRNLMWKPSHYVYPLKLIHLIKLSWEHWSLIPISVAIGWLLITIPARWSNGHCKWEIIYLYRNFGFSQLIFYLLHSNPLFVIPYSNIFLNKNALQIWILHCQKNYIIQLRVMELWNYAFLH